MRVTLSVATTSDGYMDDNTSERLVISTPNDWREVYRLRGAHDAILAGAETLRRDNPSLLIRDENVRHSRMAAGLKPDIAKVTITSSGTLAPSLRFFTAGDAEHYVFSPQPLPELHDVATVITPNRPITARTIVTELEKRGVESLFVEGGARVLQLFLDEGIVDQLRIAINPALTLGDERGGARFAFTPPANTPYKREYIDSMEVTTYDLHADTTNDDLHFLRLAIEASRRCTPSESSYCVGAVVVTAKGELFTGYTHETSPTHHAEQEAMAKALAAGSDLRGGAIYASMEPCSQRASEPESCSALIIRHGMTHVAFALYEPSCFVVCHGAQNLRDAGIDVRVYPSLGEQVRRINAHLKL